MSFPACEEKADATKAENDVLAASVRDKMGGARLVLNHSTHIPGLLRALERLTKLLPSGRVTPGRISRCRPARERGFRLMPANSTPLAGNHKLIARAGTSVQEVFVVSEDVSREALAEAAIEAARTVTR